MDLRKFFFSPPPNKWRVFKGNVISGFAGRIQWTSILEFKFYSTSHQRMNCVFTLQRLSQFLYLIGVISIMMLINQFAEFY